MPEKGSEQLSVLFRGNGVTIERICSNEAVTEWYDQPHDEWVVLLEGSALLAFDDGTVSLRRGEYRLIRAHCRHRVVTTSENALWLAVHMPGVHESMVG